MSKKSDSVRVCCRFRPKNKVERDADGRKLAEIKFRGERTVVMPKTDKSATDESQVFVYDEVFRSKTSQEDVFRATGLPLVSEVLQGYNATIFAYGQTGSGKTHTMMGYSMEGVKEAFVGEAKDVGTEAMDGSIARWQDASEMGIIPRMVQSIFFGIEEADPMLEFTVRVAYVEIYLEKVRDLLNPVEDNLKIREDKNRGVYIDGVTDLYVASFEEVLQVMESGDLTRSVAVTKMNEKSSRSHSVFILTLTQRHSETNSKKTSKLVMVDLAGSEKVRKTGAEGLTLLQAQHTNKSLAALGNVINALTEHRPHVPYRDSKLTRLLSDSLGGNSKTCLIITCSPATYNAEETYSTLRFGARAKKIKNKPKVNQERTVSEYKQLLAEAKRKIKDQKTIIEQLERDLQLYARSMKEKGIQLDDVPAPATQPASGSSDDLRKLHTYAVSSTSEESARGSVDSEWDWSSSVRSSSPDTEEERAGARANKETAKPQPDVVPAPQLVETTTADDLPVSRSTAELLSKLQTQLARYERKLKKSREENEYLQEQLRENQEDFNNMHFYTIKSQLEDVTRRFKDSQEELIELKQAMHRQELTGKTLTLVNKEHELVQEQLKATNTELRRQNSLLEQQVDYWKEQAGQYPENAEQMERYRQVSPSRRDEIRHRESMAVSPDERDRGMSAVSTGHFDSRSSSIGSEHIDAATLQLQLQRQQLEYERKCEEYAQLEVKYEDLQNQISPATGEFESKKEFNVDELNKETYERLLSDLQRKCDQNLRLQMNIDDLNFQTTIKHERNQYLQAQVQNYKARHNQMLQQLAEMTVGMDVPLDAPDKGNPTEALLSHLKQLQTGVNRLREENAQLKESEERIAKLVGNNRSHVEVLEMALQDSNRLHREQQKHYSGKISQLERELEYAKKEVALLKQNTSRKARIIVPLSSRGSVSNSQLRTSPSMGSSRMTGAQWHMQQFASKQKALKEAHASTHTKEVKRGSSFFGRMFSKKKST